MEAILLDKSGKDSGKKAKLNKAVFGIEPNDHAIYLDVKSIMAGKRQGTHKAKERGEIIGSTRKIKRQKGTGTARAGSIKNPLFVGGGRVFGPRPKYYEVKLTKKQKQLARRSALSTKAKAKSIAVIEDLKFETPKTQQFVGILNNIKMDGKKTTLVLAENDSNLMLSTRNVENAKTVLASELNTYEIMNADNLILSQSSIQIIEDTLS